MDCKKKMVLPTDPGHVNAASDNIVRGKRIIKQPKKFGEDEGYGFHTQRSPRIQKSSPRTPPKPHTSPRSKKPLMNSKDWAKLAPETRDAMIASGTVNNQWSQDRFERCERAFADLKAANETRRAAQAAGAAAAAAAAATEETASTPPPVDRHSPRRHHIHRPPPTASPRSPTPPEHDTAAALDLLRHSPAHFQPARRPFPPAYYAPDALHRRFHPAPAYYAPESAVRTTLARDAAWRRTCALPAAREAARESRPSSL